MLVISIVPRLPPAIDGVGDHALNLARQLRQDFHLDTLFIVGDSSFPPSSMIEGFAIKTVAQQQPENLRVLLEQYAPDAVSVLVHYVGYGYAPRGCPVWFIEGLEQWRKTASEGHLVTMFHELQYIDTQQAVPSPLRSGFWLSFWQKQLVKRLAIISDRCLTSRQKYAQDLSHLSGKTLTNIAAFHVFSNIGEPKQVLPLSQRKRRLIIFGQSSTRKRIYQRFIPTIFRACQLLAIEEVWDIGPGININLSSLSPLTVVELGEQSPARISEIFATSLAGLLNYHPDYLAKSGVFAAYCSHGLLPISCRSGILGMDGIEAGKQYLIPSDGKRGTISEQESQKIANCAYDWYQNSNLSVQAQTFYQYLTQNCQLSCC